MPVDVSLLHALWDSVNGIAVWVVYALTASSQQRTLFEKGYIPHRRGSSDIFTPSSPTAAWSWWRCWGWPGSCR
ncbi:hypothetical protein AB0F13_05310 [Streptomyces sp. NPDC026206]|uniref:hypothetical protein n=1 Tax=Streptomyces sp. NPDC026206 TaxID=3157089 RepID=UPI00340A6276